MCLPSNNLKSTSDRRHKHHGGGVQTCIENLILFNTTPKKYWGSVYFKSNYPKISTQPIHGLGYKYFP